MKESYAIETRHLTKRYGEQVAVNDVCLHVPKGHIYGLLGRNGAGKTSIMKLILQLMPATSGETLLFDEEHKVAITGDDYVNHRNYTPEQQEFNRFAPYLMTSVNEDSVKARAILHELRRRMDGQGWVILPGHGAVLQRDQPM